MTDPRIEETTPDQLMEPFRGRGLKSIIVFTVAVHLVVLIGTSAPFLWRSVAGESGAKLTEDQRVEVAMREATASLRDIAEKHGLKPQDLGERFGGGSPKAEPAKAPASEEAPQPETPKSTVEKELQKVEPGPEMPGLDADKEDLFK